MRKTIVLSIVFCLALASVAWAMPNFSNATLATPRVKKILTLPAAADHSPVIYLGAQLDPQSEKMVDGYAFVHYASGNAKNNKVKPPKADAALKCYGFLASGAKWKSIEPWILNAENASGLDAEFVLSNLAANVGKWESASSFDILGNGTLTAETLVADQSSPDGRNEVYFADISDSSAIAVTIVWGIFGGPPKSRQIVEWDMIFDDVTYAWSSSGEADKMDFENIATHELGHSAGLGDLYDSACGEETMYGYASYGEIKKRDLNAGDIAGINELY